MELEDSIGTILLLDSTMPGIMLEELPGTKLEELSEMVEEELAGTLLLELTTTLELEAGLTTVSLKATVSPLIFRFSV